MRAERKKPKQIADALNAEQIPTPMDYLYQRENKVNPHVSVHLWSSSIVLRILGNPIYIGTLALMKTTTVSYKNHKRIRKDSSEWLMRENNHEPIIPMELWEKVRK